MAKCEVCGKTAGHGNNVSHSKRHTKRVWNPNVHKQTVTVGTFSARLSICTRCLRTLRKAEA